MTTIIVLTAILLISGLYVAVAIIGLIAQGIYYLINGNLIGLHNTEIMDLGSFVSFIIGLSSFILYHTYKILKSIVTTIYDYVEARITGNKEVCKMFEKC
jgi:hypothetical protein